MHGCLPGILSQIVVQVVSVQVCSESTGDVEAVQMIDDPQQVVYCKLVNLLYSRHNSTTPNIAGNDVGSQYRGFRSDQQGITHCHL